MIKFNDDTSYWNKNYSKKNFYLEWPDELVVRFQKKFMKKKSNSNILDLGCGSGRHCELFAKSNYDIFGCDVSSKSISITKNRLNFFNIDSSHFIKSFSHDLPYKSNSFNYVLAWHSIYYNTFENMILSIKEISRILKKNGLAFITIMASSDSRLKNSKLISKNTFSATNKIKDHSGMTFSYLTKSQAKKLLQKYFQIIHLGYQEFYFDDTSKTSHLLIIVKKNKF